MATVRAVLLVLVAAAMIGIPAVQLFGHRPAPFGWQMYSALPGLPTAWTISDAGLATPVDLGELFARHRVEMDYRSLLLAALCGDGVAAVRILPDGGAQTETVACR